MKYQVRDRFNNFIAAARRSQYVKFAITIAFVLLIESLPRIVFAQSTSCGTSAGNATSYSQVFGGTATMLNNALQFFYGPFFKIGCAIAFIVSGVMLFLRGDEINQAVSWILRGIMIVAVIAGVVSWILGQANGSTVSAC
jgi:type IV secretory pathway VirB2 component (pilin)